MGLSAKLKKLSSLVGSHLNWKDPHHEPSQQLDTSLLGSDPSFLLSFPFSLLTILIRLLI